MADDLKPTVFCRSWYWWKSFRRSFSVKH